ncbi:hypothetical protein [Acinetobacter baumannii]|uniref:hypothetical protein n=1 Tax=Acinetobacter baumannii TaxID=470 RepID=UPI000A6B6C68|nr:hypothetical protein [Acinetobacter baumannii]
MDNYKIKVNDEAESKEAQELFFELGYSWLCCGKYYNRIGNYTFITAYPDEMLLRMGWGGDADKEITLPQLRDLVVLKRNDVNDATHTGTGDSKYYVDSNGDSYIHNSIIWTEWKLDISILKPITQTQDPALISGADALRALADGKSVEYLYCDEEWIDASELQAKHFNSDCFTFRIKKRLIQIDGNEYTKEGAYAYLDKFYGGSTQ